MNDFKTKRMIAIRHNTRAVLRLYICALCFLFALVGTKAMADDRLNDATKQRLMQINVPLYLERLELEDYVLSSEGESYSSAGSGYYLRYISPEDSALGVGLSIGADGRLLSFSREQRGPITSDQVRLPKYSLEDAIKIAQDFCLTVMPETNGQLDEPRASLDYAKQGSVVFPRLYKGIPVYRDQVTVTVDLNSGEVISSSHWSLSLEDSSSRAPQPKLSPQDAEQALQQNPGLELRYEMESLEGNHRPQPMLRYAWSATSDYGTFLGADSGEPIVPSPSVSPNPGEYLYPPRHGWGAGQSLSEDELQDALQEKTLFSLDDAEALLRQMPGIDLTSMKRSSEAYFLNDSHLNLWLHFSEAQKDEQTLGVWYDAIFDHDSRTMLSFSRSSPNYDAKAPAKTAQELQQQAETLMQLAHPDLAAAMIPDTSHRSYVIEGRTEMRFFRTISDLPFLGDSATLTWDDCSGALLYYYYYYNYSNPVSEQIFPSTQHIIPSQQAADALMERYPLQLYYYLPDMSQPPEARVSPAKPLLVYTNEYLHQAYIDAQSGEVKLRYTPSETQQAPDYTDLEEATDRDAILLTAAYLQLPAYPDFRPSEVVTQAEFLSWIYMLDYWAQPGMDTDTIYSNLGRDIVAAAEIDHEKPLTYLEGISFLLRKLDYSRFTVLRGAFQNPHNLDDRAAAYVALAKGLCLVDAKTFVPDAPLSRAEAIMLLYRYLAREAD